MAAVLAEVEGRVSYLRATVHLPGNPAPVAGAGWIECDALGAGDLVAAIDAGIAQRGASRQVAASLLSQSYAFKIGAVSLAAYALGLPWPSPAADATSVVLSKGRASGLALRSAALGAPDDAEALAATLLGGHLVGWSALLRAATRLGARLVTGNVAASCAAAFRAVEGAARDRGDAGERAAVRRRADAFFAAAAASLAGTGRFEVVEAGGGDGWFWTRTSCCLWYQVPGTSTCDDCSLIPAAELELRRRAELEGARA